MKLLVLSLYNIATSTIHKPVSLMMLYGELCYLCPLDVAAHGQHPGYFSVENKRAAATSKEILKTMRNVVSDGVSI